MELFTLQSLLLLLLLSLSVYLHYLSSKKRQAITGIINYPLVGALLEFLCNRHRFLEWSTEVLATKCPTNTAVFYRPYNFNGVITANPSNVEHMLKDNFENYPKGDRYTTILTDFLGDGIFNSDGDLWRKQRKTASYEFNTKSLRNFIVRNVVVEIQTRLVPVLNKASETGRVLNLQDIFERFAFDNVCKLAFNFDPACLAVDGTSGSGDDFMRAFEEAATLSCGRFFYAIPSLWKLKRFFNIGSEKRLRESISAVHKFADHIIRSRMDTKAESSAEDLLSRFMENDQNSVEFLRDIAISFILAGRDTTSSALTWMFWLLSSRPDVKEKILKELKGIRIRTAKNNGDNFSIDDVRDMSYLQAAISETMRLYPPVPVDTKNCLKDDIMPDGTFVGKDWLVISHTYAMGRMEGIWGKDCKEFRPERWLEGGVCRQESSFRFPVFHAGPRTCLGKDMASIQMKSIAASVIEGFEIDLLDKNTCPEYVMALTLRMKGGLPVRLRKRSEGVSVTN
ncbi:hypothetical protein TIFTF001_022404 [Ficus carica]|uniref:Cytochrome P450 n=1 Tax=Ficus carica TaxID=3494 RepID=A0AA88ATJ9_FICCA|nr:hypothetical protein TIFTF001_022404 [Ficus carica]